jgi:hypothetical protein
MARRKNKQETFRADAHWIVTTEIQINGRWVYPDTELKISGERGRFRFIKHVDTGEAVWIDVWGGPKGGETWRSFRPDRVKTVHYKNRTTENLAAEYKQKIKDKKAEEVEGA